MATAELLERAQSLATLTDPTAEQLAEMNSVADQLELSHAETVKKERAEESRRRLSSAASVSRKESSEVPPENRPDSAYIVTSAKYEPESEGIPFPAIKRPDFSVKELKESTYQKLRAIGYTDDAIGIASTDAYVKQIHGYMKSGGRVYGELVTKAMTSAGEGEPLIPIQWQELITQPKANNMLRTNVRNLQVSTLTNRYPRILSDNDKYSSHVRVTWGGETPVSLTDQGTAIQTDFIDIVPEEVYCSGDFSISMLEDNAYGLNSIVPELMNDALDVSLEYQYIFGRGVTQNEPWGLQEEVTSVRVVPEIETATRGALVYQDLVKTKKRVHQQFRADGIWMFNSNTWETISSIVDDNGRPVFMENQVSGMTTMPGGGATWWDGTLLGRPYIIAENMPDQGVVGEKPFIYYASWRDLYYAVNRVGATMKVLDQVKYQQGLYVFVLRARMGGRVVQPKAGSGLKNKAA